MARPFFTMGFLLACACGTSTGGSDAGVLRWYFTCGDPTCGGYRARDGGPPPCTSQAEGSACDGGGQSCDPKDFCNRLLVCTDRDPAGGPGCPVSRARHKRDIAYLGGDELRAYAKELEALPLATWRYNGEPVSAPRRLGFLIDDDEHSPAVDSTGERVDLYGYTSWVVAAVKVQAERIAALEGEVKALRRELARRKR